MILDNARKYEALILKLHVYILVNKKGAIENYANHLIKKQHCTLTESEEAQI